jgi:hypothetical protein
MGQMIAVLALLQAIGWHVTEKPDPMTDRIQVQAVLRGDNAELAFMCSTGTTPLLVYQPDTFLGGGPGRYGTAYDLRDFTYRLDSGQPHLESWKYLDTYAVAYSTKNAVRLVSGMLQAGKLVVRALRYDGMMIDSEFDLAGSAQALHQAFERCGIR